MLKTNNLELFSGRGIKAQSSSVKTLKSKTKAELCLKRYFSTSPLFKPRLTAFFRDICLLARPLLLRLLYSLITVNGYASQNSSLAAHKEVIGEGCGVEWKKNDTMKHITKNPIRKRWSKTIFCTRRGRGRGRARSKEGEGVLSVAIFGVAPQRTCRYLPPSWPKPSRTNELQQCVTSNGFIPCTLCIWALKLQNFCTQNYQYIFNAILKCVCSFKFNNVRTINIELI